MDAKQKQPKTLQEAIIHFADADNCLNYMVSKLWPEGVVCPTCGRKDVSFLANQRKWQCKSQHAKRQFSAKVGTVFEDSPIPLEKWLPAVWMLCNCKNGISSYELGRALKVTQKTAWFMLHRIRVALQSGSLMKMGGGHVVEVDETFVGGKLQNMHKDKKVIYHKRGGAFGKTVVMGFLDRNLRQVRAKVVPNVKRETLCAEVMANVDKRSHVYTDNAPAYDSLNARFIHEVVDHVQTYVRGTVHTNGIENFWSLLKRTLGGTYVGVEPFHLDRYIDEQIFRYNNRKDGKRVVTDSERFALAMSQVYGKRLTFAEVTGKVGETPF
jgi:transposase-like protein